jgi:hypothetical protein
MTSDAMTMKRTSAPEPGPDDLVAQDVLGRVALTGIADDQKREVAVEPRRTGWLGAGRRGQDRPGHRPRQVSVRCSAQEL